MAELPIKVTIAKVRVHAGDPDRFVFGKNLDWQVAGDQPVTTVPWITECRRCHVIAARGMRSRCEVLGRRTAKGRKRLCQGELWRRQDLEDAARAAGLVGGQEAVDAVIDDLIRTAEPIL